MSIPETALYVGETSTYLRLQVGWRGGGLRCHSGGGWSRSEQ